MKSAIKILLFVFPIAVMSNFYITFKTHIQWVDGPDIYVYGFPFSWITQQTWVNSLERHFYILQLLLNLATFSIVYGLLIFLLRFHRVVAKRYFLWLTLGVWTVVLLILYPFFKEAYYCGWWPDWSISNYSILNREFHWGIH